MKVPRRLLLLVIGALPILVPTLGDGSDTSRGAEAAWQGVETAAIEPRSGDDLPVSEGPIPLWSPGHGPHTPFQPSSGPRELLLSFDDGPDLKGTTFILEELDRRGLKAIFFVTGWRLYGGRTDDLARRDLIRKIAAHGHLVANHTLTHHNLCQNPAEQASEIDGNAELIAQATGVRPLLFRSPYGAYCKSLDAALAARDLPDIGWNLDPQDWKNDSEEAVYTYLVNRISTLKGRGILLLHDTHSASVRALPRMLDWLEQENRRAVEDGQPPVTLLDYSVLIPPRPVTESGLEHLVVGLADNVTGGATKLLAGLRGQDGAPTRSAP